MPRKILLAAALTAFLVAYGQGQSSAPATPVTPTASLPFGGPLITTPNVSLPNPQSTAGISDAGRAGVSVGSTTETAPAAPEVETGTVAPAASAAMAETPAETTSTENDLLPSGTVINSGSASNGTSLAEIASRYKAEKGTYDAKVLTNDNIQYALATKDAITMASNEPPTQQDQNGQSQSAGVQANTAPSASTQSNAAASQPQSAQATSATQNQSASSATNADNATTPQINQSQQTNDAAGTTRLPATSTFLPLLSLLGLTSGGLGLWFRKFKK